MGYDKYTWQTGEKITANKLNHIENGIEECCENSDSGYSYSENRKVLFEGSLTTASMSTFYGVTFTPSEAIESDSIVVTLNDTDYELPKVILSFGIGYGDFDSNNIPIFANHPCAVAISNGQYFFFVPSAGTYSIKIVVVTETITVSECFQKAVEKASPPTLKYVKDSPTDNGGVFENLVAGASVTYNGAIYTATENDVNKATGQFAHAEGGYYGYFSEAESPFYFKPTTASGDASHAEGCSTTASGIASHAEGLSTIASGTSSHAEGQATAASETNTHAEGCYVTASGINAHAEGVHTTASGSHSHAEGNSSTASGFASHAQNYNTIAQGKYQTAIGEHNIAQGSVNNRVATDYAFIIGNGTAENARSNALAIKWDGTFVFANGTEITPAQFASLLALLQ